MTWSTRQLADLAGTTLKAVRHYHDIGLLEQPERAANGYKQYGVPHLVRLMRIKRLADLGVPLAQIASMGEADEHPVEALRVVDAELASTIDRLRRVRVELGTILQHRAPTDLPAGFGSVGGELSDSDRALVLVYSRVLGEDSMESLRAMMAGQDCEAEGAEFDALAPDADEHTRQRLAEWFAPRIRTLTAEHAWIREFAADAPRGSEFARQTVGQAVVDLYNPAQHDVMRRMLAILAEDSATPAAPDHRTRGRGDHRGRRDHRRADAG